MLRGALSKRSRSMDAAGRSLCSLSISISWHCAAPAFALWGQRLLNHP